MDILSGKNFIRFEEIFEPTLKVKLENFLDSNSISSHLTKALLVAAVFGGIFFIGATAPNLFAALGKAGIGRKQKLTKEGFYKLRKAFYTLRKNKFIKCSHDNNGQYICRITKKGKEALHKFSLDNLVIPKPKKWDHQWRIIIFDIPHSKKIARDAFRRKLKDLNCYPVQKSVWIYPFPCLTEISFVANVFKINSFVDVYTVGDFDNTKALYHFRDILQGFLV